MKISAAYVSGEQSVLPWDDDTIAAPSATRQLVGEFFERTTVALTGGTRHQIDATADVCPDLDVGRNRFVEVKGIRRGNQAIVFAHRIARDRALINETGGELSYCWWSHSVQATACTTRRQLWSELAVGIRGVFVVPFPRLEAECRRRKPTLTIHRPSGDLHGYRIPWRTLVGMAGRAHHWQSAPLSVSGITVSPVEVIGRVCDILPDLTADERLTAHEMARELAAHGLDVVLAPAPDPRHVGHCIRVVTGRNPGWYRHLCQTVTCDRRHRRERALHDTGIKRRETLVALRRLASGRRPLWPADFRVLPYVRALTADWESYAD